MAGVSDQKKIDAVSVARPAEPQLGAEAALPARVAVQGAMQHGRCGIEAGSHAAPQLDARASRGRHAHRRRLERNGRLHMPASGGERGAARRVYVKSTLRELVLSSSFGDTHTVFAQSGVLRSRSFLSHPLRTTLAGSLCERFGRDS